MKRFYSCTKNIYYPLEGNTVEIRSAHSLFFGLFTWTSKRSFTNKLSV